MLIALSAFESLAITTVMPVISRQLGGAALYAMAFAAGCFALVVVTGAAVATIGHRVVAAGGEVVGAAGEAAPSTAPVE